MKYFLTILLSLFSLIGISQGLFISSGYISMKGGVYLVVDAQATTGITYTAGGIINSDENQTNYIDWMIQNGASGNYVIPWISNGGNYIPFTYHINASGSNDGRLLFTTWQTLSDNTTATAWGISGRPTGVTSMKNPAGVDNSLYCADRFWWIKNFASYTVKPTSTLTFYYSNPTDIQAPNTITEANLNAQYWNGGWTIPGTGTDILATHDVNIVTGLTIDAPWVLVSSNSPLPIDLLSFDYNCNKDSIMFNWSTASEINNNYFTIQKSLDAINWVDVANIAGAGNSNQVLNYSYGVYNDNISNVQYYRLGQTDYNGNSVFFDIATLDCSNNIQSISMYPNPIINELILDVKNMKCNEAKLIFYNSTGQMVINETLYDLTKTTKYHINTVNLASGLYYVNFNCLTFSKTQKFVKY